MAKNDKSVRLGVNYSVAKWKNAILGFVTSELLSPSDLNCPLWSEKK